MTNYHLTDEIIQAFLLKEIQDNTVATHLTSCSACRKRLEEYGSLIEDMQKITPEVFPFDTTTLIMEKITEIEMRKEKFSYNLLYISLFVFSSITMVLLYPYIKTIISQFQSTSIITNVFLIISASGVAVFLINDQFRQYKQKEILLN